MRLAPLPLSPRCLALLLVLALAVPALIALLPAPAYAACFYSFWVRTYYYSDPELTNFVGECYRGCTGGRTCSGEQTEYYSIVGAGTCPPICQ